MANYIHRAIESSILEATKYFPIISIIGPRQSGKTTLIKNIFPNLKYYTLEDLDTRQLAITDPRGFLAEIPQGAILDEVHNAPQLLSYIQGIVDSNENVQFVLSGSSQFAMLKNVTQSLAGRTAIFELLPLSIEEVREQANNKSLDKLLLDGFYPTIYTKRNQANSLYRNYVKTYLERDVRQILNIGDINAFQSFLRVCANRIGSIFNASDISNEIGVSSKTIKSWLSVLQASFIVTLLPPFFANTEKRLTKSPKIYFYDTGLVCYLLNIENENQLKRDRIRGHLFENFIIIESIKKRFNEGKDSNCFFYRDSNENEVDLLIQSGSEINAIEIKSSQTYNPVFESGIKVFRKTFPNTKGQNAIVYTGGIENTSRDIALINYKNLHF